MQSKPLNEVKRHPLMDEELAAIERMIADEAVADETKAKLMVAKYALDWFNNPVDIAQPSEYFSR